METKTEMCYNCNGKPIIQAYQPDDLSFFGKDCKPLWGTLENADRDGFDIREDICEVILPVGTRLVRYGYETGSYTAPVGTAYEELSLPYKRESMPYHEYVVKDSCSVQLCLVKKGIVAPGFNNKGGGVQFKHTRSILEEISRGVIEEDFSWLTNFRQNTRRCLTSCVQASN